MNMSHKILLMYAFCIHNPQNKRLKTPRRHVSHSSPFHIGLRSRTKKHRAVHILHPNLHRPTAINCSSTPKTSATLSTDLPCLVVPPFASLIPKPQLTVLVVKQSDLKIRIPRHTVVDA